MLFNSIDFLIFFPLVVIVYYLIPRKVRYIWMLVASYYFYMCWNAKYALLIATSTLITYGAALLLKRLKDRESKVSVQRLVLVGGLVANLGILFFFKYFDFAIQTLNKVLGVVHIQTVTNPFSFLLPVGISFYTFQALGYMIDVYRGTVEPEKNVLKYALFVSFFPQLVAGPIERSGRLLDQIRHMDEIRFSHERLTRGFSLMVWGLFMKMVIADRASLLVDAIFGKVHAVGTVETVLGAVTFALQIYCDFAGYSSIAIGAADICGFDLMENFNAPYMATSIKDFWRRWHISLSTWFRDYLYFPLGGSRCSKPRKYLNLLITFLVSGLWHGASWTYVIWGGIHGIYQVVGDLLRPIKDKINDRLHVNKEAFSFRFGQQAVVFGLTSFAWIFFRAGSVSEAFLYIKRMFTVWNPWVLFDESLYGLALDRREVGILLAAILVLVIVDRIRDRKQMNIGTFLLQQNLWFRWIVLIVLVVVILVYGKYGLGFDANQFIYFDF